MLETWAGVVGLARILPSSSKSRSMGPCMRLSVLSNMFSNLVFNSVVNLGMVFSTLWRSLFDNWKVRDRLISSSRRWMLS